MMRIFPVGFTVATDFTELLHDSIVGGTSGIVVADTESATLDYLTFIKASSRHSPTNTSRRSALRTISLFG